MPHTSGAFLLILKKCDEFRQEFFIHLLRPAFPDDKYIPAIAIQLTSDTAISLDIAFSFRIPEVRVRFRSHPPIAARMSMPETAVHKDDFSSRRQYKVRLSGQISYVQSKSIAKTMNNGAYQNFRFRIARPDLRHVERSLSLRMHVGHRSRSSAKLASSMMIR